MKKTIATIIVSLVLFSCNKKNENITEESTVEQLTLITDYTQLFSKFKQQDNRLYVVNYWATWCKPCIEELPEFMSVNEEMKGNDNFEMILVSLDKADEINTEVKPFIENNNITTDVYLLSDNKRMTQWIPLVNEYWSGAIPATAFYKNGEQVAFKEGQLSKDELKAIINKHL